jgi:uncharacterized iron-regulated protein
MKNHIKTPLILLGLFVSLITVSAQKTAYILYNEEGKETKYTKMIKAATDADVVLFGELHNNPISHWLQLELTKDLHNELGKSLVLGAEMFEADGQLIMDEYFSGIITDKKFEEEMRLWKNYKTDYKPLLEFAKDSGLKFISTNIPRRYANVVFNHGLDTLAYLSDEAKRYMMPLPLEYDTTLTCYKYLSGSDPMGGHGSPNLRDAQAVKDATMTHFLFKNLGEDETFIHFQGAYHSDNFESMYYFLKKKNPDLNIVTISTVLQKDILKLEEDNKKIANFIICVPETMTATY